MTTFLWIISFMLHGVSFLIIILLYTRFELMKDIERNHVIMLKDMEDLLSAYITEMKDENEAFLEKAKQDKAIVSHQKKPATGKVNLDLNNVQSRINSVEPQITGNDLASLLPRYEVQNEKKQEPSIKEQKKDPPPMPSEENRLELLPIGRQARLLHNNGLTVEDIAKKLNKGKTEIELFLKFNV